MSNPVREQTDTVRKAFKDAGYHLTKPTDGLPHPYLESCHSSLVDVRGMKCVETYVATTGGLHFWKAPTVILDEVARIGLAAWQHGDPDTMLKALGRLSHAQLVARIEESKYSITLPVPDAQLPEQLWATLSEQIVEPRNGTLVVAESAAGWTITGYRKGRTHNGKPQTLRMRIRRCGCAAVNGLPEPKLCHCVLKPRPVQPSHESQCQYSERMCHQPGHAEGIAAYVAYLAKTYA